MRPISKAIQLKSLAWFPNHTHRQNRRERKRDRQEGKKPTKYFISYSVRGPVLTTARRPSGHSLIFHGTAWYKANRTKTSDSLSRFFRGGTLSITTYFLRLAAPPG
ncbi:Delta-1-pyrroline-5-carboxylate dehydrogenase [Fusarium oxysporum f. sp. albedinis]|nr:Delta-1-pyrroline-5-carboxylate dehydrogenase [Fusarium oxysporum f. sp. albedinis]